MLVGGGGCLLKPLFFFSSLLPSSIVQHEKQKGRKRRRKSRSEASINQRRFGGGGGRRDQGEMDQKIRKRKKRRRVWVGCSRSGKGVIFILTPPFLLRSKRPRPWRENAATVTTRNIGTHQWCGTTSKRVARFFVSSSFSSFSTLGT